MSWVIFFLLGAIVGSVITGMVISLASISSRHTAMEHAYEVGVADGLRKGMA